MDEDRMEMDDEELARFQSYYVVMPNGCWQWIGCKDRDGYGRFYYRRKTRRAHRVAYEHWREKLQHTVDHLCRNRSCVNPSHLDDKTMRDNILCGVGPAAINANKLQCKRGHKLEGWNLRIGSKGERTCRTCVNQAAMAYQRRRRQDPVKRAAYNKYQRESYRKRADAKAREVDESQAG